MENAYETGPFLQVSARFRSHTFKLNPAASRMQGHETIHRHKLGNLESSDSLIPYRLLAVSYPSPAWGFSPIDCDQCEIIEEIYQQSIGAEESDSLHD